MFKAISEAQIRSIVPVLPYVTSAHLNWSGVEVHRYRLGPGMSREHSFSQLVVFLPHVNEPIRCEVEAEGKLFRYQLNNNTVSIVPPGLKVKSRRFGVYELTAIFLDPLAMAEIARAATGLDFPEVIHQVGIRDPLIRSIGTMLDAELTAEHPCPQIYADSLAAALASHIFVKYTKPVSDSIRRLSLNRSQLRRVIEFINENLDKDLPLSDLAVVANMSKYHFAKSFRRAIGIAPHQYLVRVRIEKARKLLLTEDTASLAEIARRVGYADPTFFSAQFLKTVGMSPSRYRTNR
ncbi:MAG: AraC family transcriptional regulator [Bryobacteraceae bacterium]